MSRRWRCRCWSTTHGAIPKASTFRSRSCSPTARCCRTCCRNAAQRRLPARARRRRGRLAVHAQEPRRTTRCASRGLAPAAANYAGISAPAHRVDRHADRRRVRGPRRRRRSRRTDRQLLPSISPGYGFAAIIVAFVGRLHPVGHRVREPADVAALPRRRSGADQTWRCRRR